MSERQETISDGIIAIDGRSIADRLEAAYKREKAAIEADALAVGGIVEAMRQQEVICTRCRDGEPPKNCRFFGEPDGCSSPTYGHYPQLPIGDCAKLREALEMVRDAHYTKEVDGELCEGFEVEADDGTGRPLICVIEDALAAPPRNCDRFATDTDAQTAFLREVWLIGVSNLDRDPFDGWTNKMKCAYSKWLFAPATEKEGGNDGNK